MTSEVFDDRSLKDYEIIKKNFFKSNQFIKNDNDLKFFRQINACWAHTAAKKVEWHYFSS